MLTSSCKPISLRLLLLELSTRARKMEDANFRGMTHPSKFRIRALVSVFQEANEDREDREFGTLLSNCLKNQSKKGRIQFRSSMVESLPSMYQAQSSNPSNQKINQQTNKLINFRRGSSTIEFSKTTHSSHGYHQASE